MESNLVTVSEVLTGIQAAIRQAGVKSISLRRWGFPSKS